ncbi:unnamed protein product [Spirodela intermedia]|uniref:Uncharacterized protein n=1 Tax=Spirodela intermedia TaxID=51605 RepID=A0A7I8LBZ1_SPIIN|nr:unnamed protein product [Spirodela intermedia]
MEVWNLVIVFLALYLSLAFLRRRRSRTLSYPPGPPAFPLVGNLLWLRRPFSEIESILRRLRLEYGPIVMIKVGFLTPVFVSDRDLAHKILVQSGATFAGRPPVGPATSLLTGNQYSINGLPYGPLWRTLRRNLSAEILHQSRIRYFSRARDWVLTVLLDKLRMEADTGEPVMVVESFLYAMFCLLVFMCFGEKLEEKTVREIERIQRDILLYVDKLTIFAFLPKIGKYLLKDRWRKIGDMRRRQKDVFLPLIRARQKWRDQGMSSCGENILEFSYVDTLLDMEVPDGEGKNRKLRDEEIVSLCSEFLNAGTDTTVTALEWIMANVVKRQDMQKKLFEEIIAVVGKVEAVEEEDLGKLAYLKAVVMEGLRRHPPGHFLLPHAAIDDTEVNGYVIPRSAPLNFMVTEMNWNGDVWENPMEFRPERFLPGGEGEGVDITGSKEIKMMTFGAGRRICPGLALAVLHLEFFVANLVREFEWKEVEGEQVDMTEKVQFTVVMKTPLKVRLFPRSG